MGKVSIGLRGWRFDEADVFAPDGSLRPVDEMDGDVAKRVVRLSALVGSPCDACWLEHGDEHLDRCHPATVVYGEPLAEVVVCADHETDFLYWFREAGGAAHRGTDELQDAFHAWFLDGGRAPEGYEGLEHVDTDPDDLPDPPPVDPAAGNVDLPEPEHHDIDLRNLPDGRAVEGGDGASENDDRETGRDGIRAGGRNGAETSDGDDDLAGRRDVGEGGRDDDGAGGRDGDGTGT